MKLLLIEIRNLEVYNVKEGEKVDYVALRKQCHEIEKKNDSKITIREVKA